MSNEEKEFRSLGTSLHHWQPPNRDKTTTPKSHRASWAELSSGPWRKHTDTESSENSRIAWSVRRQAGGVGVQNYISQCAAGSGKAFLVSHRTWESQPSLSLSLLLLPPRAQVS